MGEPGTARAAWQQPLLVARLEARMTARHGVAHVARAAAFGWASGMASRGAAAMGWAAVASNGRSSARMARALVATMAAKLPAEERRVLPPSCPRRPGDRHNSPLRRDARSGGAHIPGQAQCGA